MDVIVHGNGPNVSVEQQVDPTHQAARVSIRPFDYGTAGGINGGHYSIGTMTGLIAAGIASGAQVFQVRWADSSKLFVLKKLLIQCSTATGFAATTLGAPLELIVGHGSTANGSGGTALAPTSLSNKLRSSMATTAFATSGEIRIATTAALTAATGQTLEASPLNSCMGADNRTLVTTPPFELFSQRDFGVHPLILQTGDTLAIRTNSPAATGTWYMSVSMSWAEVASY
jgi:hypothetical protein